MKPVLCICQIQNKKRGNKMYVISKKNMLEIADLERKDFLKNIPMIFLLHITDKEKYIDEEELSKRYVQLVEQFAFDGGE